MGMYDTVIFNCPKCNGVIEEQSKAGERLLNNYSANEVPVDIANDIIYGEVYCGNCCTTYIIQAKSRYPLTIPLGLIEK